jgi:hypothetical protein
MRMPVSGGRAWASLTTNVLVLPGLGTLAGGRRREGAIQMLVALVGFAATCVWLVAWVMDVVRTASLPDGLGPYAVWGVGGLALCVVAWVWGLMSGLAIVRESKGRGA